MTLGKQMVAVLRRLAAEGPESVTALAWSDDERRIGVEAAGASAALDLADHDRYSVALRTLTVRLGASAPAEDAHAALSARAAEMAQRLSYLEEPLAVWELERTGGQAQLRSSPPQREAEELWYWEVTLQVGEQLSASIARYRWAPGMPEREQVVYPASFATVGRITDSLAAALAEPE
jgi:hypothetical protein